MCAFLKAHGDTEMSGFYESKNGGIFDLGDKPNSRKAYRDCITPLGKPLPSWAKGGAGSAKKFALKLTPDDDSGASPLAVDFTIVAKLSVPIVHWQVVFGDGDATEGDGPPPKSLKHTYKGDAGYEAILFVYAAPPFDSAVARFLTIADVAVGTAAQPLVFIKVTPSVAKAPAKIVFQIDTHFAGTVKTWSIDFGDGLSNSGTGKPPHFAGHTYADPAFYTVKVILSTGSDQYIAVVNVPVT